MIFLDLRVKHYLSSCSLLWSFFVRYRRGRKRIRVSCERRAACVPAAEKSAHQFAWKRVISLCGRHTPRSSPNRKEAGTLISLPVQPTSYASLPATTSRIYILFYPSRCGARAALTAYIEANILLRHQERTHMAGSGELGTKLVLFIDKISCSWPLINLFICSKTKFIILIHSYH